jgi:alpha-tubulin suppressor-like RCC1 family protein
MSILGIVVRVAIVVTLFGHSTAHATGRARSLSESVLSDFSTRLSAGSRHTCRINEDGTASCWGDGREGQLGDGTQIGVSFPVRVSGLSNVVGIACGDAHTCAVLGDGGVRCWGRNDDSQIGPAALRGLDQLTPVAVSGITNAVAVTAGRAHSCALLVDGTVRCWGKNGGNLGDGTNVDRPFPVQVIGLARVVAIAAGTNHTCAIGADGLVRCWGSNGVGQVGDGTMTLRLAPVFIAGASGAVAIVAGNAHTCALIGNGTVRCWGSNILGQLGDGSRTNRLTPVFVNGLPTRVVDIASTTNHTCARLTDGTVRCWGINEAGQMGDGTTTSPRLTPAPVSQLGGSAVAIAAGNMHTCAWLADGTMRCWGSNANGQLGNGPFTSSLVPTPVFGEAGTNTARDIAAGGNHTCAVRANGAVACWGDNANGQLGDGSTVGRPTPGAVTGISGAVAVAAGGLHTCVVLANGTVRCWGENSSGQLGDGTTTRQPSSVLVTGLTNVVGIAAGDLHTCVTLGDGGIRCWGDNRLGQIGDGTTTRRLVPTPVTIPAVGASPNNAAVAIAAGREHTCVRLADGTVRCWGGSGLGQLGLGTFNNRLSPPGIGVLTTTVAIAAGDFHTCALRAEPISVFGAAPSLVFCWGANHSGSLGDGTFTVRPGPVAVPGLATGVALAAGGAHTCAVLANGRTSCWGDNNAGQIGDGTTTQRLVPTDAATMVTRSLLGGGVVNIVTPISGVVQVATGRRHTCALGSNGGVRCWGEGFFGQLGTGSTTNALRPVIVPSFLLNIDPRVSVRRNDRIATVEILAICEDGQRLQVDVRLTQGSAIGFGHGSRRCTGALERYPVTVAAHGPTGFLDGPAQVQADARIRQRGVIVDTPQWTRAVNVVAP